MINLPVNCYPTKLFQIQIQIQFTMAFQPELARYAFQPEMAFRPDMAFRPEMAFRPKILLSFKHDSYL